jgi:SAM-dependent methyltransferase
MSLDLIAKYYHFLHGDLEEDLPMWKALAEDVSAPILEVGCGTGRLLLPLAEAGHTVTGIDLSEVALSAVQAKLEATGLTERVSILKADMRNFDLPHQNFALALLPLNTFMHCHTMDDQLTTLQTIHKHLQSNGRLIIDLFHPDPLMLSEVDGRLYFEAETIDELTGHTVQWFWRHDIDLARQMRHLIYVLDEIDDEGLVRRTQIPFSLRFVYRFEMELLLGMAGFNVETIYGSYELAPFDSHSPRMIFVAQKR